MNVKKSFVTALVLSLTAAASALATPAVGTAKARGDYRPGAWAAQRSDGSRSMSYRAPMRYSTPSMQPSAPAPQVAQSPNPQAGRTFSYSTPASSPAMTSMGCGCGGSTAAPAAESSSDRVYSYTPSASAQGAPQSSAPTSYAPSYARPSYSRSGGGRAVEAWQLPKTDPRKFTPNR